MSQLKCQFEKCGGPISADVVRRALERGTKAKFCCKAHRQAFHNHQSRKRKIPVAGKKPSRPLVADQLRALGVPIEML